MIYKGRAGVLASALHFLQAAPHFLNAVIDNEAAKVRRVIDGLVQVISIATRHHSLRVGLLVRQYVLITLRVEHDKVQAAASTNKLQLGIWLAPALRLVEQYALTAVTHKANRVRCQEQLAGQANTSGDTQCSAGDCM